MDDIKIVDKPAKISFFTFLGDRQGCGHIRVMLPYLLMNSLRLDGLDFQSDFAMTFIADPKFYTHYTTVSFQRASTEKHLHLIRYYKNSIRKAIKVPVLLEIDDLLWDIPEWNYASSAYNPQTDSIKTIISEVDGVTVSTPFLKEKYSNFSKRIAVIPNHLSKFIWGDINPKHENNPNIIKPRILYAGSENHFINKKSPEYKKGIKGGDFGSILIDYIRKTTDKYQWVFSGAYPLELEDLIDEGKIERHPWKHILQYPHHIKSLDVDIWLAPLYNCDFNKAKSNIKALEATATGCPCIFSNIEPYKKFMFTSDTEYDIINNIEKLAKDVDLRKKVFDHDYNVVKEQLFWEENNNIIKYVNAHLMMFKRMIEEK